MRTRVASLLLLVSCTRVESPQPPAVVPPEVPNEPPLNVPPPTPPPECQIQSSVEHGPGWPFTLPDFRNAVLPLLLSDCAGCHTPAANVGEFKIWADAAPGNCSYAKTFNAFSARVDLDNPSNSAVYVAVSGGNPAHPLIYLATDPKLETLLSYVTHASETKHQGDIAPPTPPPAPASPFDYGVFQSSMQRIIDTAANKGCTNASCHGADLGIGGFKLHANAARDSAEILENFNIITSICDLVNPEQSKFYLQATHLHGNGQSAVVSLDEGAAILAWIEAAKVNAPADPGTPPATACAGVANFNLPIFNAEILPILLGRIDLNNRTDTRVTTGCARASCHGQDRTGGALVIKETNTALQNLQNFACFVDFTNPVTSEILTCPSNLSSSSCRRVPHPGDTIFADSNDKNYERILSYLYAAKTAATPLDFAFFARRINPIFSDPTAIAGGNQGRTCSGCHGVAVAGQSAPNGSNFPMIGNASDRDRLAYNFSAAANFVNFIQPEGSSLFLYPTNEIANLDNPFSSGLPHPGGEAFAIDSVQALDILTWAGGLRPDQEGQQRYWLVAGDYSGASITDITAIDELNITPKLLDPTGASQFNNGQWEGLFSDNGTADLQAAFPRPQPIGRIVYAVAYLINSSANDIQAQVTITSPNAVKMYIGAQPVLQADDATNGATGLTVLPHSAPGQASTRVLVKVLQRATDDRFEFSLKLADQFGNLLTGDSGELLVKLGPDGGI